MLRRRGFALTEFIVVMLITGILIVLPPPAMQQLRELGENDKHVASQASAFDKPAPLPNTDCRDTFESNNRLPLAR